MNIKSYLIRAFLFSIIISVVSCANMVSPTGGPKDTTSPYLISSVPEMNSLNMNSKEIVLNFNEYIDLKNIQNEFIISPGNIEADIKKDGKRIKINLSNKPLDNTTYILNFGNAIVDYTENNISKDFKFIFSTGNTIDSLNISGNVLDAFKLEPVKDALVSLYIKPENDSVVIKNKPDYTVRTNDQGVFRFTNLKENSYKLFVLVEENNNKLFDTEEEKIAFVDTLINLRNNIQLSNLKLFKEIPSKKKLINKSVANQKIELNYNKANNTKISSTDINLDTIIYSKNSDSISIYYKNKIDSTTVYSVDDNKTDTIKFKFAKNLKKKDLNIVIDNKIYDDKIIINSADLFRLYNKDSIQLFEDSQKVNYTISKNNYNSYIIDFPFRNEKKYEMVIGDSAFVSFENVKSKKIKSGLYFRKIEDYGSVLINLNNSSSIIYELINEKNDVIRRSVNKKDKLYYTFLSPGTYRLRLIYDENNNEIWDTGNYLKNKQPEKVEYYSNPIKIRANWDLEINLIP